MTTLIRRPDSTTVLNHGQRLILNRGGVEAVAALAAERADKAYQTFKHDEEAAYLTGVAEALRWLAGGRPSPDLQRWLGVEQ